MPHDPEQELKEESAQKEWLLPPRQQKALKAGLYLVPTPIGNLADITLRALDVLCAADFIYCEDTRVTKKLLSHYGVKVRLSVYNDHSTQKQRDEIIAHIQGGKVVVLVSDAGTPLISDPGYKLVRDMIDAGLYMTALPGANAVLPALQLSGLSTDKFTFLGFLPQKEKQKADIFKSYEDHPAPLIFYESATRIEKTLNAVIDVIGDRDVAVVREISKMFEESRVAKASDVLDYYKEKGTPKGEIVFLIAPKEQTHSAEDIDDALREALKTMRTKDAAEAVAQKTGRSKKELYDRALVLEKEDV